MKVLLVSNYLPDGQQSMQRFAAMLEAGLVHLGHEVRTIRPRAILGRARSSTVGVHKWLGYIDKYLLFPAQLRRVLPWADVVHICDHSNAVYVRHLQAVPHLVTCHDLLAVRGAFAEQTDVPASAMGKILQNWILKGLGQAQLVACDSTYTKLDLERLLERAASKNIRLILLGLNYMYRVLTPLELADRLVRARQLDATKPFILHVGSSLRRKNREGVLRIFHRLKDRWHGQLVFAGEPLTDDQTNLVSTLDLTDRVVQVVNPDGELLEALYNAAFALLFPSRFEGFGWPVIEAQACGCPVVCSDRCSLPEVVGTSALTRAVDDEVGFATDILRLADPIERRTWVARGFDNIDRFKPEAMISLYSELYTELSGLR